MSTVYNESCFKINQGVSLMLVFVDLYYITYINYKSSHAVFYDLVSTHATVHMQFFDDLWSGIKLRTRNITKILFRKIMNDS